MKACVLHAKKDLRFEDIPEVEIKEAEEVKVKILAGGICGSDQHYYLDGGIGSAIVVREPIVIGHEGCGIVEEVGSGVTGIRKGDMVVLRPARPCFHCRYCENHQYSFCENMRHLGSAATFPHALRLRRHLPARTGSVCRKSGGASGAVPRGEEYEARSRRFRRAPGRSL